MMTELSESKCLVIMGKAGAGKDTLAAMINELIYGTAAASKLRLVTLKFSTALKGVCADLFGWDRYRLEEQAYKEEKLPITDWLLGERQGTSYANLRTRREILCHVGTNFRNMDEDVWVNTALRFARACLPSNVPGFICTDCRYPNEQEALGENFGKTRFVKIHRTGIVISIASGHSSEDIDDLYTDMEFYVEGGDLDRLRHIARLLAYDFFPELLA